MKSDPEKIKAWRARSVKRYQEKLKLRKGPPVGRPKMENYANPTLKKVSDRRRRENQKYAEDKRVFLAEHPICPVTGRKTTEIHHTAHREGAWLLLRRYWVAVDHGGHIYIEANKEWAFNNHLIVKVNALYDAHCNFLNENDISLDEPLFYKIWTGKTILPNP